MGERDRAFSATSELAPERSVARDIAAAVLETTTAFMVVLDRNGRILRFNPACERLTGHREAEVIGQLLWPLVLDEIQAERAAQMYAEVNLEQPSGQYKNYWMSASGERQYIRWATTRLLDAAGELDLVIAIGLDVNEERRVRLEQEESEARFRALFERSSDGVVLIDPHDAVIPWRIVDCNPAFARMNGYDRELLIGQSIDLVQPEALMARKGERLLTWIRAQRTEARVEGLHRRQDGHIFHVECSGSLITLGERELVLSLERDISERKQTEAQLQALNEQLAHEAHHDALTGLPNRALLYDRLTVELSRLYRSSKTLAVVFIDLDEFKQVNDVLGHAVGDQLLEEVARRLKVTVRPNDTVARMGGDEFVVLVPDLLLASDVTRVVQRMQTALALPFRLAGSEVSVNASIGITVAPENGDTVDTLLYQADTAMYQAKRAGKNDLRFFSSDLTRETVDQDRTHSFRCKEAHPNKLDHLFWTTQPLERRTIPDSDGPEACG